MEKKTHFCLPREKQSNISNVVLKIVRELLKCNEIYKNIAEKCNNWKTNQYFSEIRWFKQKGQPKCVWEL